MTKINLKLASLMLGFAITFGFSAFKASEKRENIVRYQYHNSTSANIDQVTSWDNVTTEEPEECAVGSALPCIIEFDTEGTYPNLAAYLSVNDDASSINGSPEIRTKKGSL